MKQIEKAKQIIEEILAKDETARNSDTYLILKVWEKQNKNINLNNIKKSEISLLFCPETITRHRRYIQNTEGRFLGTMEVTQNRRKRESIFIKLFGGN